MDMFGNQFNGVNWGTLLKSINRMSNEDEKLEHYSIGESIGIGSFGDIKVGYHIHTKEKVAIKILHKSQIRDANDIQQVTREIQIQKNIHHNNIVQIYDVVDTPSTIYIIMEYVDGGELFQYIVEREQISEDEALRLFQQIFDGVSFLHSNLIAHRDLKPENILISRLHSPSVTLKITNFGLSNYHKKDTLLKTACGSPCYAAPEMILGKGYVGPLVDVWSMGIILFALICGYLPFEDDKPNVLYEKIVAGDYSFPQNISEDAKEFISHMLCTNPDKRLTAEAIRSHPWCCKKYLRIESKEFHKRLEYVDINMNVLEEIEQFGIKKGFVIESIANRWCNPASACYFLAFRKYQNSLAKNKLKFPNARTIRLKKLPVEPFITALNFWKKPDHTSEPYMKLQNDDTSDPVVHTRSGKCEKIQNSKLGQLERTVSRTDNELNCKKEVSPIQRPRKLSYQKGCQLIGLSSFQLATAISGENTSRETEDKETTVDVDLTCFSSVVSLMLDKKPTKENFCFGKKISYGIKCSHRKLKPKTVHLSNVSDDQNVLGHQGYSLSTNMDSRLKIDRYVQDYNNAAAPVVNGKCSGSCSERQTSAAETLGLGENRLPSVKISK